MDNWTCVYIPNLTPIPRKYNTVKEILQINNTVSFTHSNVGACIYEKKKSLLLPQKVSALVKEEENIFPFVRELLIHEYQVQWQYIVMNTLLKQLAKIKTSWSG